MVSSRGEGKVMVDTSGDSLAIDTSAAPDGAVTDPNSPIFVSDRDPSTSQVRESSPRPPSSSDGIAIVVPPVERPWEYQVYQDDTTIATIREEIVGQHEFNYLVQFQDGHEGTVSSCNYQ